MPFQVVELRRDADNPSSTARLPYPYSQRLGAFETIAYREAREDALPSEDLAHSRPRHGLLGSCPPG